MVFSAEVYAEAIEGNVKITMTGVRKMVISSSAVEKAFEDYFLLYEPIDRRY